MTRTSKDARDSRRALGHVREGQLRLCGAHGAQQNGKEHFQHLLKRQVAILQLPAAKPAAAVLDSIVAISLILV